MKIMGNDRLDNLLWVIITFPKATGKRGTPLNNSIDIGQVSMVIKRLCQDQLALTLSEFCTTSLSGVLSVETSSGTIEIVRIFLNGWGDFCWKPRRPAMPGHFCQIMLTSSSVQGKFPSLL